MKLSNYSLNIIELLKESYPLAVTSSFVIERSLFGMLLTIKMSSKDQEIINKLFRKYINEIAKN